VEEEDGWEVVALHLHRHGVDAGAGTAGGKIRLPLVGHGGGCRRNERGETGWGRKLQDGGEWWHRPAWPARGRRPVEKYLAVENGPECTDAKKK
jgi:hypothetical protein